MNYRTLVLSLFLAIVFVVPLQAHGEKLWGVMVWAAGDGKKSYAAMTYNYARRIDAYRAAVKICVEQMEKSGESITDDYFCGFPANYDDSDKERKLKKLVDSQRGYATGSGLVRVFGSGECMAYASGIVTHRYPDGNTTRIGDISRVGGARARTKEKAEKYAITNCVGAYYTAVILRHTCQVTMSACMKP